MGQSYVAIKETKIGLNDELVRNKLDIELTERCNNNCVHCCVNLSKDDETAMGRELSTGELIGIMEEAASLNYMMVHFTGGEPLLRKDFSELYLSARKMGLKVQLFTNAALITKEIAGMFSHVVPGEIVEVTLYGLTKESYERATRAHGTFDAAWRGIQLLRESGIPFVVKSVILPSNRHEIPDFIEWSKSIPWMDGDQGFSYDFLLRNRRDDEKRNALIRKLRVPWDEGLRLTNRDMDAYMDGIRQFAARYMYPPGDALFSCEPGGCVDARGFFSPCLLQKCPEMGYDLRKGSLTEAVTSFLPSVKKMRVTNASYLNRCARCFLKGLCEQCPARAWIETGSLDTPSEYLCEVAHDKARCFGLLHEQENAWEVVDWKSRLKEFCGDKWKRKNS